jgi:uncharacterized protein (UPF0548 family)
VFLLRKPSEAEVAEVLAACADAPFSYEAVGATRGEPPAGYTVDRWGETLGRGGEAFARAREAVRRFEMYPAGWIAVHRAFDLPSEGAVFASVIRHLGFWSVNPGRIIYLVDERDESGARYGFAFGTLPGHAEEGEERFVVRHDAASDEVRYEVVAFSRPRALLARLGAPIARAYQKRFARESRARMLRAVAGADR